MSDPAGMIIDTLQGPLAALGFVLAPPERALTDGGAAFLYGNLQIILEPSPSGAAIHFFVLSSFGDWVPQDVSRWGIPSTVRYKDTQELKRQVSWLVSVLRGVLKQADIVDPGGS